MCFCMDRNLYLQITVPHFFYSFLLHSYCSYLYLLFFCNNNALLDIILISAVALSFAPFPYFLYLLIISFLDTVFVCACGSPGAGRNHVTPRYYRHFNIINYVELSAESMQLIFSTVLTNFLSTFEDCVSSLTEGIVGASIDVYNAVLDTLKPTPSKPHYTFNMRDVSKVSISSLSSLSLSY